MKRIIIFGYLLFVIFSIVMIDATMWFMFISLILLYPMKRMVSKLSYEDLEEIFLIKFFRNKFPNNPLCR